MATNIHAQSLIPFEVKAEKHKFFGQGYSVYGPNGQCLRTYYARDAEKQAYFAAAAMRDGYLIARAEGKS